MCILCSQPQTSKSKPFYYSCRSRIDQLWLQAMAGNPMRTSPSVHPAAPSPAVLREKVFADWINSMFA